MTALNTETGYAGTPAEQIVAAGIDDGATTPDIQDGAITAVKLATDAVETLKIKDLNVTTGKIAALAVTTAKIDAKAVTAAKIDDLTITAAQIAANAVTTAKIIDAAVTQAKMATATFAKSVPFTNATVSTTMLAAYAADRAVIIVANVTTATANGDGAQPTFSIGETSALTKFVATSAFTTKAAGTTVVAQGILTASTALIVTATAGSGTTETGAISVTVFALPN